MSKKSKDTDYLVISARIRAMETQLLTQERMEQMLSARTDEEVAKLLQDSGYPDLPLRDPTAMDAALSAVREALLEDFSASAPDPRYIDVFKLKYDYHNAKVLLKAQALGTEPGHMLMDMGRVPAEELREAVDSGDFSNLSGRLSAALEEAKETLDATRDPQLSDIVLDRWYYRDILAAADETGSKFLKGYVRTMIDAANLRALVRTIRMGKNAEFLHSVLVSGGVVGESELLAAAANGGSGLAELFASTALKAAGEAGAEALKGGSLTDFEKQCDDAVSGYLEAAGLVAFGEAPLVGYLAARETEYTNLRILLMGRAAGLNPEIIRARLRV